MTRIETYGREAINTVLESIGRGVSQVQSRKPLSYDLLESDTEYLVVFDAPGATAEDVQVQFVDGELTVRIDRFRAFHKGFEIAVPRPRAGHCRGQQRYPMPPASPAVQRHRMRR